MKVFKFGGASANSIERIQNIPHILKQYEQHQIVMIISAMGKTTNALEKVAEAFYNNNATQAIELFNTVKQQHITTTKYLLVKNYNTCYEKLNEYFTEAEWLLHDKPVREFDYYYDQIVCIGELLSTTIISYYLQEVGINNTLLDARDLIRTDNNFREANINWSKTTEAILQANLHAKLTITQGFIGCTDENESTTLGREGSDFTAAIFANILEAESVSIWKDVEGVMNADPKTFANAVLLPQLSFEEVIEMAYYGAQVIHPKTIKPLQNKSIPLHVKCFLDASLPGTTIAAKPIKNLPPIIVLKENQTLIHLKSLDYSFVGKHLMAELYTILNKLNINPALIQTGAINVQLCLDNRANKIEQLAQAITPYFDMQVENNLHLLTIRHYNTAIANNMLANKTIILQQTTTETLQALYR
jgi:aspartate kinase